MPHLETASAAEVLQWTIAEFGKSFAIATSFQKEGMVVIDLAVRIDPGVRIFTLDTGRIPRETREMIETVQSRYGSAVEAVLPDAEEVDRIVREHGTDLFYQSVDLRKLCCEIRKVRPLTQKLKGLRAWATGLRRSQSADRSRIGKLEEVDGRVKINPLADWSAEDVERYIREHDVPVHPLYASGYRSIGCEPCTRPVQPGEDERAGRWWWEQDTAKECGIHFAPDGSLTRIKPVAKSNL